MGNEQTKRQLEEYKRQCGEAQRENERLASRVEVNEALAQGARDVLQREEQVNALLREHMTVNMAMQKDMINEFRNQMMLVTDLFNTRPNNAAPNQCSEEIVDRARRRLGLNTEIFYNFGFAGHVSAGKSSLINGIRGLTRPPPTDNVTNNVNQIHDPSQPAKVDIVECTTRVDFYVFPNNQFPHVRFYDIPGSGTMSSQAETYFQENGLCAFDCLLIFVQQALGQEEIKYAKLAKQYRQPVAFVRSKCDQDVLDIHDHDNEAIVTQEDANAIMNRLRENYVREIQTKAPELRDVPIYFVSSVILRKLVNGTVTPYMFMESKLLEFVRFWANHSRNNVT